MFATCNMIALWPYALAYTDTVDSVGLSPIKVRSQVTGHKGQIWSMICATFHQNVCLMDEHKAALTAHVAFYRFVEGVLTHFYKSDHCVQRDNELQQWIKEIFANGFLENESTGLFWSSDNLHTVQWLLFKAATTHNLKWASDAPVDFKPKHARVWLFTVALL